jgi:hypothetical protein
LPNVLGFPVLAGFVGLLRSAQTFGYFRNGEGRGEGRRGKQYCAPINEQLRLGVWLSTRHCRLVSVSQLRLQQRTHGFVPRKGARTTYVKVRNDGSAAWAHLTNLEKNWLRFFSHAHPVEPHGATGLGPVRRSIGINPSSSSACDQFSA